MNNFDIPILFIIFNRLDTTKQVFDEIRRLQPLKLYIASDGPRKNRDGEDKIVEAVRSYVINSIDWNCQVKTFFREKNLGCGKAVSGAISWFFQYEEMGIILEDDCLPSTSFFSYCKELLEKYKDDQRIFHITGHNPLTIVESPYSYYFSRIQHCWGWASWKRAWDKYNFDINDLDDFVLNKKIDYIFKKKEEKTYWLNVFKQMVDHKIDTWDYQWTYSIFNNNGYCINPTKNLITNIGFNQNATHTFDSNSIYSNQPIYIISEIVHPKKIIINNNLMKKISKIAFQINTSFINSLKNYIPNYIKKPIKKLFLLK